MLRVIDDIHLSEIGNALRETLGEGNQFPPKDMGDAVRVSNEVAFSDGYGSGFEEGEEFGYNTGFADGDELGYQAGMEQGYNSGKTDGIEEGKKAQYDEFWDGFQNYGNRRSYNRTFNQGSTAAFYNPKYPLKGDIYRCFYNMTDIADTKVPILATTNLDDAFAYNTGIRRIVLLEFQETTTWADRGPFHGATKLVELNATGTIAKSITFAQNPLNTTSLKSIIEHLKDFSGGNEHSQTVTFKSSAFSALEAEGATAEYNGVACTWAELIGYKKWNLVKA